MTKLTIYWKLIRQCSEPKFCLGGHARSLEKFTLAAAHSHESAYGHLEHDDDHVYWMTADELCEAISRMLNQHAAVEKSQKSAIVNKLVRKSILKCMRSKKDKRVMLYGITKKGLNCAACIEMNAYVKAEENNKEGEVF